MIVGIATSLDAIVSQLDVLIKIIDKTSKVERSIFYNLIV